LPREVHPALVWQRAAIDMQKLIVNTVLVAAVGSALAFGCASDDPPVDGGGGTHSHGGDASSGGNGTQGGTGGGQGDAGAQNGGGLSGGQGGHAGSGESGAPTGGTSDGGAGTGGGAGAGSGGEGGLAGGAAGAGGAGGEAGAAVFSELQVERGRYLVVAVAQCGGCHTDSSRPTDLLGGNAKFRFNSVTIGAGNLTNDGTGLGGWTNAEIKRAFRNGVDRYGRQLVQAMPYWLYHNLTDADADAIVAYLRSLPKVVNPVGAVNAGGVPVPFLSPSDFPDTSLEASAERDAALQGKYLLTSAARCVACHSPLAEDRIPARGFAGRAPTTPGGVYPPNLTPDATGIAGWSASDVAGVLLNSLAKGTTKPICNMPRYAGLSSDDALAIGQYLTTIPAVENVGAALSQLPACP
jgi:mono/diheme cytochrome c family protein